MNVIAPIGHNLLPDPIDEITAAYESARVEAENWTDGESITNEEQMKVVDTLRESMRQWRLALQRGQKDATTPLREVYQAELDRWKPTIKDATDIEDCLVATVKSFKAKLAEEKKAAERAAWEAADKARKEAEAKAAQANEADLEAKREAAAAAQAAKEAEKAAQVASKDKPKGMRKVTKYEIEDHRAALHHIAQHDRDAVTAFIDEYVRRNHKAKAIAGVRVWEEREAF